MTRMPRVVSVLVATAIVAVAIEVRSQEPSKAIRSRPIDFNRDVRPILSDSCFHCHGPDEARRQGKLRLDVDTGETSRAIFPGDPDASELVRRMTSSDPDLVMPPPDQSRRVTPAQVELVKRWIAEGAERKPHWAFTPPLAATPPEVQASASAESAIDRWVLAELEASGASMAPEADRATLLRRVSLDLTGVPPTIEEADDFLADRAPDAYERLVERLLASPRYGERMAIRWLEAARYADTSGYQTDGERVMWRWRDWVIDALNAGMPFDQFTIEQLAGDLLPGATLAQRIATGFNRNHRGNAEGGIVPEEYAVEYVVDRVDTTSTVWLGLTMGCARCHDHKYDPLAQRDFYRMYALFNRVPEKGRAIKYGNSAPAILTPTDEQQASLAAIDDKIAAAESAWNALASDRQAAIARWEQETASESVELCADELVARWDFDGRLTALGATEALKLAAPTIDGAAPRFDKSASGQAAQWDGQTAVVVGEVGAFGFYDKFTISAWIQPDRVDRGTIVSKMSDVQEGDGWSLRLRDGKLQLNLVKRWLDDSLRVQSAATIEPGRWRHVAVSYDGSRFASGVRFYVDGELVATETVLDELNQEFAAKEPLRIGAGGGPNDRFAGALDELRLDAATLAPRDIAAIAVVEGEDALRSIAPDQRTVGQQAKIEKIALAKYASEATRGAMANLTSLKRARARMLESFPTTMVMQDVSPAPTAYVLTRGEYDKPGEQVEPGAPAALGGDRDPPRDRLEFARWLTRPDHPLTARVAVNRMWQQHFGVGLVKTVEDFGSQGRWPTHPELLDALAVEFATSGWDVKRLQRAIVTSAAYQQSSRVEGAVDPENRLLGRAPRARLPAEMIRDQALAAAGALVERVGGPSVRPYQPAGLWKELGATDYDQDHGEKLYRRGIYTFWKRTVPPPTMSTFDAGARESCIVRESRTNTPLQALTLLNETSYVEAARLLAERTLGETDVSDDERLTRLFRRVVVRTPSPEELTVLRETLEAQRVAFAADPAAGAKLLAVGESKSDPRVAPAELAAWSVVAGIVLNLDEAVVRP